MSKKQKLGAVLAVIIAFLVWLVWHVRHHGIAVMQPRGAIGEQEKHLIVVATLMSLVVVVPVFLMLFGFAWKYREGNKKAKYQPDLDGSRLFESIWWGVPIILILILGVIAFRSAHDLDPFKPVDNPVPPMTIQVVALQWRWLFIYPAQDIASMNFVQFPVNTPVKFEITSDAPMNSFWIPQLGGQIYAMSGMGTTLNLLADKTGDYQGVSANISGEGFAGMHFIARASSQADFIRWAGRTSNSRQVLTQSAYDRLAQPSTDNKIHSYGSVQSGIFDSIIAKYQAPALFNPEAAR